MKTRWKLSHNVNEFSKNSLKCWKNVRGWWCDVNVCQYYTNVLLAYRAQLPRKTTSFSAHIVFCAIIFHFTLWHSHKKLRNMFVHVSWWCVYGNKNRDRNKYLSEGKLVYIFPDLAIEIKLLNLIRLFTRFRVCFE